MSTPKYWSNNSEEHLLIFLSPKGSCESRTEGGPIVFTNILSPKGRCVAYPVGVQSRLFPFIEFWVGKVYWISKTDKVYRLFFASKCFIPRREMHSISSGGPIIFTYVLFWVRKGILEFQNLLGGIYETAKILYIMDGWTHGRTVPKSVH